MPGFDPKQFIAANSAPQPSGGAQGSFDPKKFISEVEPTPVAVKEGPGVVDAVIRGVSKGATANFADEAYGLVGAAVNPTNSDKGFWDRYHESRDYARRKDSEAEAAHPTASTVSEIGGGIASTFVPGMKLLNVSKGGGAAAVAGNVAKGVGQAVLTGAGQDKDFTDIPGNLVGHAVTGLGTSLLGEAGGKVLSNLAPSALRKFANEKAVSAAGAMTKEMRDLGPEGVQALGARLIKDKVVQAFSSLEDVATRAGDMKKAAGEAIGKALGHVDELVQTGKSLIDSGHLFPGAAPEAKEAMKGMLDKQFQFNMKNIGDRIEKELVQPNAANPLLKGEVNKLRQLVDDFRSHGTQTLKEGNVIKGTQGRLTNFDSDTVPNAFKQEVYGVIKTELDNVVAKTGNLEQGILAAGGKAPSASAAEIGNQTANDAYQSGKKAYGAYSDAEDMALKSLGRTNANRTVALSDIITGTAAAATGGPVFGAAVGAGSKLVRKYGDSVGAVALNGIANTMDKTPEVFGKFAGVIERALKRGTLPATNLELMKDPDYRRIVEGVVDTPQNTADPNQPKRDAIKRRLGE